MKAAFTRLVAGLVTPHEKYEISVTMSAGVTTYNPVTCSDTEDLLVQADRALYVAKRQGRNQVATADQSEADE